MSMITGIRISVAALTLIMSFVFMTGVAFAGHNGADVSIEQPAACAETTFTATIADPDGTHKSDNMQLIVDVDGVAQVTDPIPTDGSEVSLAVGKFNQDKTVSWRVFGGGERDYDQPHWNGYGEPNFNADVGAYGDANGFGFVVAGTDDPNPFTTWNTFDAQGCYPVTVEECKKGGWAEYGFSNQGLCIQFVNTGKDSR